MARAQVIGGTAHTVEGSAEYKCELCGQTLWLSPTGQAMLAEHNAIPVCLRCGMLSADGVIQDVSEEQKTEMRANGVDPEEAVRALDLIRAFKASIIENQESFEEGT